IWLLGTLLGAGSALAGDAPPRFERDVLPIVQANCVKCHGMAQRKGGLDLRTLAAMTEGGDSGPALVKRNVAESRIIEQGQGGTMPRGKLGKLSAAEVGTLKAWVAAGCPGAGEAAAKDPAGEEPGHWAFRPPARPRPPTVADRSRVRNPIDAFLLNKL